MRGELEVVRQRMQLTLSMDFPKGEQAADSVSSTPPDRSSVNQRVPKTSPSDDMARKVMK